VPEPIVVDYLNIVPTTTTTTTTTAPTTLPVTTLPSVTPVVTTLPRSPIVTGTLPRTGNGDAARQLLRWGDLGFVAGVASIAAAGLVPARRVRRAG
jgi:hypothetical protein